MSDARKRAWTKYNNSEKKKLARRRYYLRHKEKIKEDNIKWREENRDKWRKIKREWAKTDKAKELSRIYCVKNRLKRLAKDAVNNEIKSGRLVKNPCVICGNCKVEGHHSDYNKPLEVIWLCKRHHFEEHNKINTNRYNISNSDVVKS